MEWFLLTGQPQTGKTTVVKKTLSLLKQQGILPQPRGFITEERINAQGKRCGFNIQTVGLSKEQTITFATKTKKTKYKTGQYFVDPEPLDTVGVDSISHSSKVGKSLYVIDEIGRMEMHSTKFKSRIVEMLEDNDCVVIGTVAAPRYGHVVPLAETVKANRRVNVYHIKKSTRDEVCARFQEDVLQYLQRSGGVTRSKQSGVEAMGVEAHD